MNTKSSTSNPDWKSYMAKLDETLDLYLVKKAPFTLPENVREIVVKIAPYAAIISVIFGGLAVLFILGITAVFAPLLFLAGGFGGNIFSAIMLGVAVVFEALAISGLMNKTQKGWNYTYYGILFNIASNVLSLNLFGAILGGLVGLYFLYQVKTYYK